MHSTIIIAVLITFKNLSSGLRKIWPPFCFFNSLATPLSHLPGPWVGQWRWWWWKSHCLSITHLSLIRLLSGDGRWGMSRHQCAACCWGETFRRSWRYFWSWRAFWEAGGGRGWRWRRGEENEERGGESGSNDTLAHFRQPELFGKPLKWSYSHIIVRISRPLTIKVLYSRGTRGSVNSLAWDGQNEHQVMQMNKVDLFMVTLMIMMTKNCFDIA